MQFAQLLQLREVGVPIPNDILLESCTLQNKKELIDSIQRAEQQQQQIQQMQLQQQIELQKAQTDLAHARAQADRGLGIERVSRVEENHALAEERVAAAKKDNQVGLLNLVKALKEIDEIEINQIGRLLELSRLMKEQPVEEQVTTGTAA